MPAGRWLPYLTLKCVCIPYFQHFSWLLSRIMAGSSILHFVLSLNCKKIEGFLFLSMVRVFLPKLFLFLVFFLFCCFCVKVLGLAPRSNLSLVPLTSCKNRKKNVIQIAGDENFLSICDISTDLPQAYFSQLHLLVDVQDQTQLKGIELFSLWVALPVANVPLHMVSVYWESLFV